jgi:hypothetical protein
MTNSEPEKTDGAAEGIADDQLPEDLRPSEDNPLAEPLENRDDAHSVEELDMQGGKTPEGSDDDGDHPTDAPTDSPADAPTDSPADGPADGAEAGSGS